MSLLVLIGSKEAENNFLRKCHSKYNCNKLARTIFTTYYIVAHKPFH